MQKICRKCHKIIINDYEKWLEENKEQHWIQCPYCFELEEIKWD